MDNLFFWKHWPKKEAMLYLVLLAIFVLSLITFVFLNYFGQSLVFDWQVFNNIKSIQVPIKTIETSLTEFFIEGTNYINLQEYVGSTIQIHTLPAILLTIVFFVGISLIIALATTMSRFWFLVIMGVFIFMMVMTQMNDLQLFGLSGKMGLATILGVYILPAYYFHAINTYYNLITRVLIMLAVSVIFLIFYGLFSGIENPFLAFAGFGLYPPVILSIIFIVLVGHEIISFFLYIITNNNNEFSKNSSIHFSVISLGYLLLVLFTFLYNTRVINWQLIYLNAFFLLIISAILGIWGFKNKKTLYENIFGFQPIGGLLYLILGIICLVTIGYFFATANDPAIEAFEDIILFTQLGFGITFFIYIVANFFTLLHYNEQVHKIMYKPTKMPYFTAQLAGVIASLAFFFMSNKVSMDQSIAARNNALGNYYHSINQSSVAKEYFKLGAIYGYRNHLSNYNLASIYLEEGDVVNAVYHFNEAKQKNPTEQAFVNLSHVYERNDSYFEALFTLKDGLKRFPNSGIIANNLALKYNKTDLLDSALFYLYMAKEDGKIEETALANEFGFYAGKNINFPSDSLVHIYKNHDNIVLRTHVLALLNQQNHNSSDLEVPSSLKDSLLNINQYAFLQNYLTHQKSKVNDELVVRMPNLIENAGDFFEKPLLLANSIVEYEKNNVYSAMEQIQLLQNESTEQAEYFSRTLAALALDKKAPQLALDFLNYIDYPSELENQPLLLQANAFQMLENAAALDVVAGYLEDDERFVAIKKALWTTQFDELNGDLERYYYIILRGLSLQPYEAKEFITTFNDKKLATNALKHIIEINLENNQTNQAESFLEILKPLLTSDDAYFVNAQLKILYQQNEFDELFNLFNNTSKGVIHKQDYLLYSALLDLHNNKKEEAEPKFKELGNSDPFFEAGILESANYFENSEDEWISYNILLQATRFNKYSKELHKTYVMHTLKKGLSNYAEDALSQLENLMDQEEYRIFMQNYDSIKQTVTPEW